jgi:putative CocE/NonD family hydrolase
MSEAQNVTDEWLKANYCKKEVMIVMRDGVKLFTAVYEPFSDTASERPIIMVRTPYGTKPYGKAFSHDLGTTMHNFVLNKYIIVYQSVRGTYMSEGVYENVPSLLRKHSNKYAVDEATDTYDTIEWLLHNTHNNGRVGIEGVSYPGFYAMAGALCGHPALRAVSPQAPVTDWFMGDDMHHNGALFLSDMYSFGSSFFRKKYNPTKHGRSCLVNADGFLYDYFREKPLYELLLPLKDSLEFLNAMMQHPNYDDFWKDRDISLLLRNVKPAVMLVGGEYDAEDCYGTFRTYKQLKKLSPGTETFLVEGPWYHGAWHNSDYDHLDGAFFGNGSADYFMDEIEYPFFSWYLEGKGKKPAPVNYLPSGETDPQVMSGKSSDRLWITSDKWPLKNVEYDKYYLGNDNTLSRKKPPLRISSLNYVSDPDFPVPYFHKNTESRGRDYMAGDQSFASKRADVLSFTGSELCDTLKIAGPLRVHLRASASGTDADFVVKLIDVRPDGYQMLVRGDVMPARFRNGFSKPKPLIPGKIFTVDFTMNDIYHYFLPGHKLMVQVQSSWFPLVAMNPQTFIDNPYRAVSDDYKKTSISVFTCGCEKSYIVLPTMK